MKLHIRKIIVDYLINSLGNIESTLLEKIKDHIKKAAHSIGDLSVDEAFFLGAEMVTALAASVVCAYLPDLEKKGFNKRELLENFFYRMEAHMNIFTLPPQKGNSANDTKLDDTPKRVRSTKKTNGTSKNKKTTAVKKNKTRNKTPLPEKEV